MSAHGITFVRAALCSALGLAIACLSACDSGGSGGMGSGNSVDTTPPTVSVTAQPAPVSRVTSLSATASDDVGVTQVEFIVDGVTVGTDRAAPFSVDWNTAQAADGTHSVVARATDAAGNSTTAAAVTVTVQNNLNLSVDLSNHEEIPAVSSSATGLATLNVNLATGAVSGTLALSGLTATAAHIHSGFAGRNGPVIVGFSASTSTPGAWDLPANAMLTTAQVDDLLAGGLYLNAHSQEYPGGEIRGQILPPGITVGIARLDGLQELPAVESAGEGEGGVTINRTTGRATIHLTVRNVAGATAAHLHDGYGGRNGPVLIPLTQDGSDPTHWFATDQPISQAAIDAFDGGGTYVNVHTPTNPNGEIRGQVATSDVIFAVGRLSGSQEVPDTGSSAQGTAAMTVSRSTRSVLVHANVVGIDDATASHVHEAYAGVSGPIILPLTHDSADPTHWSASGATLTEAQLASLEKGSLYVNVHTAAHPGGEVRAQIAPANVDVVYTTLSGDNEVPPVSTSATGTASTTVDFAAGTVTIHVHATGLDDATGSHIHRAAVGENGPIVVPLTQDPSDVGHWSAVEQSVSESELDDFESAAWYVNVHTPANPSGEVRGQIGLEPSPAPDTTAPIVALAALTPTVTGTVTLMATATDDTGVTLVRFTVGGNVIGTDTSAPYEVQWNTTTAANGSATIGAEAVDAAGNVGAATPVVVTVSNVVATTLSELQSTIFGPRCSGCHTGGGATLPSSMNLSSAAASYASLVNVASTEQPAVLRVSPNNPAGSYLVRKLEGDASISGARMPFGGPFLSASDMDKVRSWINSGAPNN
jgi:CHRD domain/Bacterial Ig domain